MLWCSCHQHQSCIGGKKRTMKLNRHCAYDHATTIRQSESGFDVYARLLEEELHSRAEESHTRAHEGCIHDAAISHILHHPNSLSRIPQNPPGPFFAVMDAPIIASSASPPFIRRL